MTTTGNSTRRASATGATRTEAAAAAVLGALRGRRVTELDAAAALSTTRPQAAVAPAATSEWIPAREPERAA